MAVGMEPNKVSQAEEIMEAESGGRRPRSAALRWGIFLLAVAWSVFQLWATYTGSLNPQKLGAIHVAFALALVFLLFPSRWGPVDRVPWYDWVLVALGTATSLYIVWAYYQLVAVQGGLPITRDVWFGTALIAVLVLAAIRSLGFALPIVAGVVVFYGMMGPGGLVPITPPDVLYLHNGYSWSQIIQQLYITGEGIWGTPIQVSATFVFLFVLFGAFLEKAGAGQYFVTLAYSGLGAFRGGPAKASVVASLMTGVISGSSTANVVTTGTFTIPLMRRIGYPATKAGATEVAASVNGQLMPPVMGAAAFIMADFTGVPYSDLIVYALVPALLAYAGLLFVVHLEALKLGLEGVPRAELPPFWNTFKSGIHYLIPVVFLLYELMVVRLTPERSALNATALLAVIMILQSLWLGYRDGSGLFSGLKTGLWSIVEGLERGARNMTMIAVATGVAGIVVGMVTMTNLGYGLTQVIGTISGGNIWVVLILSAVAAIILGMGLPTTANYVVMAALVAPIISQISTDAGMTVHIIAIHLFVFYFGILADDTPPVGVAAYAAAAISGDDPIRTGVQGFIYDLRTAILPFMFFFNPSLLLLGEQPWWYEGWAITTALFGMLSFVAGTQGYLLQRIGWIERLILIGGALMMIKPGFFTDVGGFLILAAVYAYQRWQMGSMRTSSG